MSETITEWQKIQFQNNVTFVHQQMATKFTANFAAENKKPAVQGKRVSFPIVGSMVARDRTERYEETQWGELEKSIRWCVPYRSYQALPFDDFDAVRSAISDVNSVHARGIAAALRRAEDKRGITAAIGNAAQGEAAGSTVALPTRNTIALGSTPNDVLTLDKIKQVSAIFDDEGFPDMPGDRHWYYGPGQKLAILAITQATSADFVKQMLYERGNIDGVQWMGFTWHMLGDVRNQGADGLSTKLAMLPVSGTQRTNIAYCKDAMGMGHVKNLTAKLDQLPQKTYTWQAYAEVDVDCVRVLDGGVCAILCLDQTPTG